MTNRDCGVAETSFLCARPSNRFKLDLSELRQAAPDSCPEALMQVTRHALHVRVCDLIWACLWMCC